MVKGLPLLQKLEIVERTSGGTTVYKSRIEDIGEEHLLITAPAAQGNAMAPLAGRRLYVQAVTETGIISFDSRLLSCQGAGPAFWLISPPQEMQRIQRRSYVRLDFSQPLELVAGGEAQRVYMRNLSGGGLNFAAGNPLTVGDKLTVRLALPQEPEQEITVEVRHSEDLDRPEYRYSVGVEFTDLDERNRQRIVRYIFQEQLARRKRGLE